MAQPSVAREPSMEEILASIRRIIESNDPASDAASLHPIQDAYGDDEIEEGEEFGYAPETAANDPGMPRADQPAAPPAPPAPVAPAPAAADRSLSLADVAARVRAASVRQQEIASSRAAPPLEDSYPRREQPALQVPAVDPDPQPVRLAVASQTPALAEPEAQPMPSEPAAELRTSGTTDATPAAAENFSPRQPQAVAPIASPSPFQMDAMAGLLSESAGAQIARSFGELAAVFDGLERRSVEDMAQEMLRPMLQEWLDDNLPTIVERLVREEIERVARGPRR